MYTVMKATAIAPSQRMGLPSESWLGYQLDTAISLFGQIVEGALNEMENVGDEKEPHYEQKYTLTQLLDPDFRLPVGEKEKSPIEGLKRLKGKGIKFYKGD